jgi:sulfite exporter TauE/SafE
MDQRDGARTEGTLTIGTSLFLIAVGAILKFAVTAHVEGVNLHTVGVILMIVGGIGLAIGLFLLARARSATTYPPSPPPVP